MLPQKIEHPKEKDKLHPRNKHRERYNFKVLIRSCPELAQFVSVNKYNDESIDFFNPEAVKMLNKALLKHFYGIKNWNIPPNYLCPPIPGRADYIHHIADLLASINNVEIPRGNKIKCLDIGVGANCVYPIIGNYEYGWSFVGSDIDSVSIQSASQIIQQNLSLLGQVEVRLQNNPNNIFQGIIRPNEYFELSICNPPFHSSLAEAQSGTLRKLSNLNRKAVSKPILNFGGKSNELWCQGGEERFVRDMIRESKQYATSCLWFSSLISKEANLNSALAALRNVEVVDSKVIPMGQGNKISRLIAWTFLSPDLQQKWVKTRWTERIVSPK